MVHFFGSHAGLGPLPRMWSGKRARAVWCEPLALARELGGGLLLIPVRSEPYNIIIILL